MMISIIIPTYNRAAIIKKTLDSVANQTFKEWECIVVDDHSTDNTYDIIDVYTRTDPRFKYMKNERKKGAQGARNTGLYSCDSDWVFFFDSDNQLHPNCLQELASGVRDDVDVVQCFSVVKDVNTRKSINYFKWINNGYIEDRLYSGATYVDFNHAIIRRSKMFEIGGLDEDCPSMQEWDTHLRLSKIAIYNTVEEVLVDYYVGAQDAISTDNKKAIRGRLYNLEKHLGEWKRNKIGYYRFVYIFYDLISKNQDPQFRNESKKKLDSLVDNRRMCAAIGYIINKWYGLKKYLK